MKNILIVEHVPFEKAGLIGDLLIRKGFRIDVCEIFNSDSLPDISLVDGLIVMGGPMGIFDYEEYPWLNQEKQYIRKIIDDNKPVLGVCLGAQLIADVLGAKVYPNNNKEIGVFPIDFTEDFIGLDINFSATSMPVFHWHGDTFEIPPGAVLLASSRGCRNQGFLFNGKVLALQFHLESTEDSVKKLLENCSNELVEQSPFIQKKEEILDKVSLLNKNKDLLDFCLNKIFIL